MRNTRLITLSGNGLGANQYCCRWINMGGYWAWVCSKFFCHGGDMPPGGVWNLINSGQATILKTSRTNPSLLGAALPPGQFVESGFGPKQKQYPQVPPVQLDIMSWIKDNWVLAGVVAIGAYLIFKK
jgi:hypothetical protein